MSDDYSRESMHHLAMAILGGALDPDLTPASARLLEDEIERRNAEDDYIRALMQIVAPDGSSVGIFWKVIRATPEQRAQAFLRVLEDIA
jgi:hypothetical protein